MAETVLWVVKKDGHVLQRGFQNESAARGFVEDFVRNLDGKRAGTKVRVPDFDVRPDHQYAKDDDQLYREHKTHVQVTKS